MTRYSYGLVAGTFNTHLGYGLDNGAFEWLLERVPWSSLWFLQEVPQRRDVIEALERAGVRDEWAVIGPQGDDRPGLPYVLARKRRFKIAGPAYSRPLAGAHARRLTEAHLEDRYTGRNVYASSIHVDPLGKGFVYAHVDKAPGYRSLHERQVQAYADRAGSHDSQDVVIYAGDLNESLDQLRFAPVELQARHALARFRNEAHMRAAFQLTRHGTRDVTLDDVLVRPSPFVSVGRRRVLEPPFPNLDHAAVVARLSVKAL